jgi:hypothetical protein
VRIALVKRKVRQRVRQRVRQKIKDTMPKEHTREGVISRRTDVGKVVMSALATRERCSSVY